MSNHDRDTMKKDSDTGKGGLALLGILGAVLGSAKYYNNNKKSIRKQEIQYEIQQIDREIENLSSGFFGSLINGSEIDRLKAKKAALKKELAQL